MQRRHRSAFDSSLEPVAHHQLCAFTQFGDERHEIGEVVAIIGVAHDHVLAAGSTNATNEGISVALVPDGDHPGAGLGGELPTAVGAAVVGNDHLAVDTVLFNESQSFGDTGGNGLRLIEAGNDNGQFHWSSLLLPSLTEIKALTLSAATILLPIKWRSA